MLNDKIFSWEQAVQWLREQPDQSELVRACFFDDPLITAAQRYHVSTEWLAVRQLLPVPDGQALDLGAGRGISTYALASDGWQTTALEPDSSDLVGSGAIKQLISETQLDVEVVQEWGESLPFKDNSFDVVHGRQVLHHARDLHQLCSEIGRVLKPGGVFVATREHVLSKQEDLQAFLDSHPLHFLYGGENAYTVKEYLTSISLGGIKIKKVLNPLQSDINLYPETIESVKKMIEAKLHLPVSPLIPNMLLGSLGYLLTTPGRLYTFVGRKH